MQSILERAFQGRFRAHFPGDDSGDRSPRQTPGMLWSTAEPTPVAEPLLPGWSEELAATMGIRKPEGIEETGVFAGNGLASGMKPYAACYGGHQFGHWAGQLGDGRAITLGELDIPVMPQAFGLSGERDFASLELQLKGAGPTAYSRRADGRAVLRSSVREFLMSEAMHHLGIPTTRALALVATGEPVIRDMFYDGNPQPEPGAIVCRVAPSFLRFGSFELLFARGEHEQLRRLADWVMDNYYPHIDGQGEERLLRWVEEVMRRTAHMIVEWMRVGFVHGVMNTDNMSILGLTIDYGPYSMLDGYDPLFTPNTTDLPGRRYAFERQAAIGKWNLSCFAGSLSPLLPDAGPLAQLVQQYDAVISDAYYGMMVRKMGLPAFRDEHAPLVRLLVEALTETGADYTIFFHRLAAFSAGVTDVSAHFSPAFYAMPAATAMQKLEAFLAAYRKMASEKVSDEELSRAMNAANPQFILRNYKLHEAIAALEAGDHRPFDDLYEALQHPYDPRFAVRSGKRPDWAADQAGCSMLSCSS